jgi:hypothetical protein
MNNDLNTTNNQTTFYPNVHYIKPICNSIVLPNIWDYTKMPIVKNLYAIRYNTLNPLSIKRKESFPLRSDILYHISHIPTSLYYNISNNELYHNIIIICLKEFTQYNLHIHHSLSLNHFKQFFLCYNNTGDLI